MGDDDINLLRGKRTRGVTGAEALDAAIGETDASVFNCPVCQRPLSHGTAKCPACGVRLIMGLRMTQAGGSSLWASPSVSRSVSH